MSRAAEKNKAFSEDIDRVLAGQPVGTEHAADAEYQDALKFARRMAEIRTSPDAEWRAAVKARLTRLAEAETGERHQVGRGWLGDFIRQPVWQAMAGVVILVMVGVIVWASGAFKPASVPSPTAIPTTVPAGTVLSAGAGTDKPSYSRGEEVHIDVSLKNVTSQPFKVVDFPPILSLMDDATKEPVYTFAAGQGTLTLAPGQETRFSVSWDQRDALGNAVPAGRYYIELEDLNSLGNPVQLRLSRPVYFDVRSSY